MIIIVGLGNPGEKYINTRHNIGFDVVDEIAKENNFPKFKLVKKYNALISEKNNIVLVKPQTFMNESGKTVKRLSKIRPRINYPRSDLGDLIVIHDDIDLKVGEIKIVKNRGSAGHKGAESIIKELGTRDFIRVRIGIQPKKGKPKDIERFVLEKFEEKDIIKEAVKEIKAQLY